MDSQTWDQKPQRNCFLLSVDQEIKACDYSYIYIIYIAYIIRSHPEAYKKCNSNLQPKSENGGII